MHSKEYFVLKELFSDYSRFPDLPSSQEDIFRRLQPISDLQYNDVARCRKLFYAKREEYNQAKPEMEKLEAIVNKVPLPTDSWDVLSAMHDFYIETENPRIDRVAEVIEQKLKRLPYEKQRKIVSRYNLSIDEKMYKSLFPDGEIFC